MANFLTSSCKSISIVFLSFAVLFSCVQSYHHFEDTHQVTRALVQRLQPNGRLVVLDFVDDEGVAALFGHGHSHRHEHIVAHKHGEKTSNFERFLLN